MEATVTIPDSQIAQASQPKAGYKTTEFWGVVAAAVLPPTLSVPPQYLPYIVGLAIGYAALRAGLKAAHAYGLAKNFPDLPDLPALPLRAAPAAPTTPGAKA